MFQWHYVQKNVISYVFRFSWQIAECETPDVSFGSGVLAGGGQTDLHARAHKPVFVCKIMKVA